MKKACYTSQMREIDRCASDMGRIPSIILMENAAIACINELKAEFGDLKNKRIGVFCGKGNNGGDGFAIARHLINSGADVRVLLVCGNTFKGDALINYEILENMDADIDLLCDIPSDYISSCDIVIDAIYGTGIHGLVFDLPHDIIEAINTLSKYTLAVDIPSGVNGDTGEVCGICIKADTTVTFAGYKLGMFLFDGADYMGKLVCADISIPQYIIDEQKINKNVLDDEFVKDNFPKRTANSHKGTYGKVFIVGGSVGMTGAAYMASQAALNMGSGLITLGIPSSLNEIMENKLTEVMTVPLPDSNGHLIYDATDLIVEKMNSSDVILFGCGIGRSPEIRKILKRVLAEAQVPVVLDADGLYALDMDMLNDCSTNVIITPHNVEFARLAKCMPSERNRFKLSEDFATKYGLTLVLKGHHTIVTACDGVQYINTTGNSGMATGGSGDVLAGMIASLIGRGVDEPAAAAMAVYLHGRAGDIASETSGENSLTPTLIIDNIYRALTGII